MKAIRVRAFGPSDVLELEELPTPAPAAGQALIRIHATGVNPVDTYVRAGTYPSLPPLPYTPGTDAAGTVESVGPEVTHLAAGQRVYLCGSLTGTYASHALADANKHVRPLPEPVSFEQGAGVHVPYYTAFQAAFHRGQVHPGETVLVHGATGGVGLAALQLLSDLGVILIGTGSSEESRQLILANGAHHAVNHGDAAAIKKIAPKGVDLILEMLANVNLPVDLPLLAPGGRVIVIGNRGETTINPRALMATNADIRGMSLASATPAQLDRMHAAIHDGLDRRRLVPLIANHFPLADAPKAHETIAKSHNPGKIVLIPEI